MALNELSEFDWNIHICLMILQCTIVLYVWHYGTTYWENRRQDMVRCISQNMVSELDAQLLADMFACFLCIILLWTYFLILSILFSWKIRIKWPGSEGWGQCLTGCATWLSEMCWLGNLETWNPHRIDLPKCAIGNYWILVQSHDSENGNQIKTGLKEPLEVISLCSFLYCVHLPEIVGWNG